MSAKLTFFKTLDWLIGCSKEDSGEYGDWMEFNYPVQNIDTGLIESLTARQRLVYVRCKRCQRAMGAINRFDNFAIPARSTVEVRFRV